MPRSPISLRWPRRPSTRPSKQLALRLCGRPRRPWRSPRDTSVSRGLFAWRDMGLPSRWRSARDRGWSLGHRANVPSRVRMIISKTRVMTGLRDPQTKDQRCHPRLMATRGPRGCRTSSLREVVATCRRRVTLRRSSWLFRSLSLVLLPPYSASCSGAGVAMPTQVGSMAKLLSPTT